MDLKLEFRNPVQREFYYATARNQCFSGAFNNGKSFIGCAKVRDLALTYYNSHWVIARQTYTDLKKTTMETFFKLVPRTLIKSHNQQDGLTVLFNDSKIFWLHLDSADESTLKGFEINGYLVDQAEETDEKMFDVLDARIGRWDEAIVPQKLLDMYPEWPVSATGKYLTPSYGMLLCNPDTEFHYIYRKFHPESIDRIPKYFYTEGEWDKSLGSEETYENALTKDVEWVDKFVKGKWGSSTSAIHKMPKECVILPNTEDSKKPIITQEQYNDLIERCIKYGNLYRSMDHGDSSPTACGWVASLDGVYIFYREYYSPGKTISYHRQAISDLSNGERYNGNYADPQIFKKTAQKDGGFWSVSDEYLTNDLDAPALAWIPADNNEFATRNRINELLIPSSRFKNPITGESPAPGIYFIGATANYPYGCKETYKQLGSQRKVLLGTLDGKSIYSDDRDESITDHAYDIIRYFIAMHGAQPNKSRRIIPRKSFEYYNIVNKMLASRRIGSTQAGSIIESEYIQ